ncbi:ceramide glucosyltransferase [Anabrus simplex]|uniref:ceramide glucosyltransferase n=1 Tax=Anabrus simplex TaxID=316456 RepID=UPI0035A3A4CC
MTLPLHAFKMAPVMYTIYGFAIYFFFFWCGKWGVHLIAIFYGKWRLHKKISQVPCETPFPGVSILKPLMGVDPNLFGNLETFFTMNYPLYELLFCVEDESDPAIMLVRRLMEKYPKVSAKLFTGGVTVGVNPKINNMQPGFLAAKYELILISDSGIRMKEDTLLDMVSHLKDDVGLVHQMPFTCDRDGFAATLEKIYFGTAQARIYLAAAFLGVNCHTGMSTLMRKTLIDEVGGIQTFSCYLAEDFFLAKSLRERGWKMCISSQPAWQNSGLCEIHSFQARLTRWAKLRAAMVPQTIVLEPQSECMVLGAIASWSVSFLFKWDPLVFYLVHILVWFLLDWILLCIVQNGSLPFSKFDFVVGWLFRECSSPYLFLHALWDPAIRWRGRTYKLKWGGIAEELKPKVKV